MKKLSILLVAIASIGFSCQQGNDNDPFLISHNQIGSLDSEIKVSQLDSIFKNDSVVKVTQQGQFSAGINEIEIYEKGGKKLLILEPNSTASDATIKDIQIIDHRFHTDKGLSVDDYFIDIKKNYPISKINNMISTAVIFVDSIQAYITIDKKELPKEYMFNTSAKIKPEVIPDSAKIKYFWVNWDQK